MPGAEVREVAAAAPTCTPPRPHPPAAHPGPAPGRGWTPARPFRWSGHRARL